MMERLLERALCVIALGACGGGGGDHIGVDAPPGTGDAAPAANTPGRHDETLTVGTLRRTLIVYVPEGAQDVHAPVVFMLHGTSGDGQRFFEVSGWKEKADAEGMIVVFPDALVHCYFDDENGDGDFVDPGERKVTTKWAQGYLGDPAHTPLCTADDIAALSPAQQQAVDHPLADDVAFFDAMLAMLATEYAIDDKAIYVSGFSNGGQMAARLAVERSDRIAAVHAAAGTLVADGTVVRPLSMIFSVGSKDDRFTEPAGVTELPLGEAELGAIPVFQGIVGAYVTALELEQDYTYERVTVGTKEVARFVFATSAVGASNTLQVAVIDDLFHVYPNGTNHPVSAPDLLWTFFASQRLP